MNIKVTLIHNTIAPYRHPLFEEVSKKMNLIVYYCSMKENLRKWDLWPRKYDYKYKVLPRIFIKTPIGELSLNPSILKEVTRNKPDVMIISGYTDPTTWFAFAVAKLLRIPIIYWTEGIREPRSILGVITRPLRIFFVERSNAIIVPGKLSKRYVIDLGADVEKVFIAPNVIDNELFIKKSQQYFSSKDELKNKIGLKGKIVILYVGQLTKGKGINFLLEAYKKLKRENNNVSLLLVGYGELYNMLRNEKINDVVMTGPVVKFEQLVQYYSMADIFVLPTLNDVWGFVINEAMACGLPVISTYASQAAIEMIRSEENGYIVKAADSDQLYDVLKNLIQNSALMMKMSERSREIVVQRFNVAVMVEGFLSAIKHCIVSV